MFPNQNYGSLQYNSRNSSPQNHQILPLIRQLPNNSSMKHMLVPLYNLPQTQNQFQSSGPLYSQQPYNVNANQQTFGLQVPFYSGQKTSIHSNQSYNLVASKNVSFSHNSGLNQQFQNQHQPINFGFDLSDFGIPNPQPIKYIFKERKQRFRKPQAEEFPADFLDRIPLPKIQKIDHRQNKVKIPIPNIRTEFPDDEMGNADAKKIQKTQQKEQKQSQSQLKLIHKKVVQQKIRGITQSYKPLAMQVVIKKNNFVKYKFNLKKEQRYFVQDLSFLLHTFVL